MNIPGSNPSSDSPEKGREKKATDGKAFPGSISWLGIASLILALIPVFAAMYEKQERNRPRTAAEQQADEERVNQILKILGPRVEFVDPKEWAFVSDSLVTVSGKWDGKRDVRSVENAWMLSKQEGGSSFSNPYTGLTKMTSMDLNCWQVQILLPEKGNYELMAICVAPADDAQMQQLARAPVSIKLRDLPNTFEFVGDSHVKRE